MKIFSLETKKHLVGWSLVAGFILFGFFQFFNNESVKNSCPPNAYCTPSYIESEYIYYIGYPFTMTMAIGDYPSFNFIYVFNFSFWFLVVLIILILIRHFRPRIRG